MTHTIPPGAGLTRTVPNLEDIPLPGAKPYALWGVAGGAPLLALAVFAAVTGWPDIVAYLFGLAGLGGIFGGITASMRQQDRRTSVYKATLATISPEVLAHATLDPGINEASRILIANHLNATTPDWHSRLDSDTEDWQTLKAAGANMSSCFRGCGKRC